MPRQEPVPYRPRDTRTVRAAQWVISRCDEKVGHQTTAKRIYAAYRRWAAEHEPDPLAYGSFIKVLDGWAPAEYWTARPRTYHGIILRRTEACT